MDEFSIAIAAVESSIDKFPVHPDKILFAEDLVNYINDFYGIYHRLDRAERFREIIYNAFTETVKTGISNIETEFNFSSDVIDNISSWDEDTYFFFAGEIRKQMLDNGLEPVKFLYFCVDITHLAGVFLRNGLSNAPELAVIVIYDTLIPYDMLLGGWDSLNFGAKTLRDAVDHIDITMITPDTSSEETSDNEMRQRISGSSSSDTYSDDERTNIDTDDNISSDGCPDELKVHVADSENTSPFNTERCAVNLHLPKVPTGNQHIEPIHDFTNSVREKREAVTQQEDVKDNMNVIEKLEAENLPEYLVIPNGRPLQHAYEYQIVVEGNGCSTNGETHGANMHKDSLYKY